MAIYILDSKSRNIDGINQSLSDFHHETYIISIEKFEKHINNIIEFNSLIIFTGIPTELMLEKVMDFCLTHHIPLLIILDSKEDLSNSFFQSSSNTMFDVMFNFSKLELKMRVNFLFRIQEEVNKRIKKEAELERALNHINEDLAFAKQIQQMVLPKDYLKSDIQIQAIYEPSELLSGDIYFWIEMSPNEYGIILIDVSGHGVHAALVSMAMRSLFPGLLGRVKEPAKIAKQLNEHMLRMFDELSKDRYITSYFTAQIIKINTAKRTIKYVNAGHQPGLFIQNNKMLSLQTGMVPIGLIKEPRIEFETIHYEPNSKILLFTDGLTETPYSVKENRLEDVKACFMKNANLKGKKLLEKLLHERKAVSKINDDLCAILISLN